MKYNCQVLNDRHDLLAQHPDVEQCDGKSAFADRRGGLRRSSQSPVAAFDATGWQAVQ
jgi:hypothetical protein